MNTDLKTDQLESRQSLQVGEYILDSLKISTTKGLDVSANNIGFNIKPNRIYHDVNSESNLLGLNQKLNRYPVCVKPIQPLENSMNESKYTSNSNLMRTSQTTRVSKSENDVNYNQLTFSSILPKNPQNVQNIIFNESSRGGYNSRNV